MNLRAYQVPHVARLVSILRARRVAHDGSDTGTGKSFCGAQIAKEMAMATLVICPLSVIPTWGKVLSAFGVPATVMNYESAWRKLGTVVPWGSGSLFRWANNWPLIIFDECHRCSDPTTYNGKMLLAAKRQGSYILTLSATAADSVTKLKALGFAWGLHDLKNFQPWAMSFGAKESPIYGRGGKLVMRKNGTVATQLTIGKKDQRIAMQRLHHQIFGSGSIGSRMRIADIPDFPQTIIEVVELNGASKEVSRLSEDMQAFFKQRNAAAQFTEDELAKLTYWRQASEVAKIPVFMDMAEDALETSKVVVFVNFSQTMDELLALAKKRGWTTGFIRGQDKDRQLTIDAFQSNKTDFLVCNIQAGGVGVSLHDDKTQYPRTCLICPTWRAVDLKQVFGRARRDGGGLSRQFLVCWSTGVEAIVARSVRRNLDNMALLNDAELDGSFVQPGDREGLLL